MGQRRSHFLPLATLVVLGLIGGCAEETSTNTGSGGGSAGSGAGGSAGSAGSVGTIKPGGPFFAGNGGAAGAAGSKPAAGSGGAAGSTSGGGAGQGNAGSPATNNCGLSTGNATCDGCLDQSCCAQEQACAGNPQCVPLLQCVSQCSSQSCANSCGSQYQGAVQAYNDLIGCFQNQCGSACGGGSDPQGGGAGSGQAGSGAGGQTDPGPPPATDEEAQYCVDRINQYRATLGLPALQRWYDAEVCSDNEAKQDAQTNTPHGAFGQCGEFGQNECPGWGGPIKTMLDGCLQMMWDEGPGADFSKHGHYLNMSSTQFTRVACGFHQTSSGSIWSVQNFQ